MTRTHELQKLDKAITLAKAFRDASRILCSELDEMIDNDLDKYYNEDRPAGRLLHDLEDLIRQFEKRTNTCVLEFDWKE